jgi:zinc transporter ZupT
MVILFSVFTFISTFLGGMVSLRYKDKLHLILGFTAGVLLAVVAFDLIPEIMELIEKTRIEPHEAMIALIVGFLIFHILEKLLLIHHAHEETYGEHKHPSIGILSALALSLHSFMDGVGIGVGFKTSTSVGILVALAVISHDFSDGLNTASLMTLHNNPWKRTLAFVLLDAATPVIGACSTLFFSIPQNMLVLYLGFFSGFLLYIGASDILPEAHSPHPSFGSIFMTLIGVIFIYFITLVV